MGLAVLSECAGYETDYDKNEHRSHFSHKSHRQLGGRRNQCYRKSLATHPCVQSIDYANSIETVPLPNSLKMVHYEF